MMDRDRMVLWRIIAKLLRLSDNTMIEIRNAASAVALVDSRRSVDVIFSVVCVSGTTNGTSPHPWPREHSPKALPSRQSPGDLCSR